MYFINQPGTDSSESRLKDAEAPLILSLEVPTATSFDESFVIAEERRLNGRLMNPSQPVRSDDTRDFEMTEKFHDP